MADTVTTKWIWPPNWDGGFDDNQGTRKWTVQLTGISDGTGEAAVRKVDISTLFLPNGGTPAKSIIERIEGDSSGYTALRLYWDRTPAENIAVIGGDGNFCLDYTEQGGNVDPGESGDGTGDIMLTTTGYTSGDSYNIKLTFRLK